MRMDMKYVLMYVCTCEQVCVCLYTRVCRDMNHHVLMCVRTGVHVHVFVCIFGLDGCFHVCIPALFALRVAVAQSLHLF
jgi:hypothetical protein